MIHTSPHLLLPLTRRYLLQGTLRGLAGLAAWTHLRTAAAQARAPQGQMTWPYMCRSPHLV